MSEKSATPDPAEVTRWVLDHASEDLDAALDLFADEAVWDAVPLGSSYRGVEEIRRFLEDWYGSYEDYETEAREVRHLGNGVVLGVTYQTGRLVDNPLARIREVWAFVSVWTDAAVTRVVAYSDIDQARAAAERPAQERG